MSILDYVALGRIVRAQRKSMHLTQEDLAEKAGLSLSFIGHIERGSKKASADTVVRLCDILNLSIDEALGRPMHKMFDKGALARDLLDHACQLAEAALSKRDD